MTPEQAKHFKQTSYKRYPFEGKFLIHEETGAPSNVTLWVNDPAIRNLDTMPPRRFFEEDSTFEVLHMRVVPPHNIMGRHDYDTLLSGLHIPLSATPEEYTTEQTLYIAKPGHQVIIEQTRHDLPPAQHHRRIRRQKLSVEGDIFVLPDYRRLIKKLEKEQIIFAEDFSHWKVPLTMVIDTGTEMKTRINAPRK